jgi:hypothetical protein
MVCGKKGCPRERNLREIYTENSVGTTARPSFLVTTLLALEGAEAIAYWGGGAKFSWAQGRKIPKYGPGCSPALIVSLRSQFMLALLFCV